MNTAELPKLDNGWDKYAVWVINELKDNKRCHKEIKDALNKIMDNCSVMKVDIKGLKIKSGIWGIIGGAVPVVVLLSIWIIRGLLM